MIKTLKIIVLILIGLYSLNQITLSIFGKTSIVRSIIRDTHTSYVRFQWTEDVNLVSDLNLNQKQIQSLKEFYQGTKADFKYLEIEELEDWSHLFNRKETFTHMLFLEKNLGMLIYTIEEGEKIEEYYHGYKRKYFWLFFTWILIDEQSLGIS